MSRKLSIAIFVHSIRSDWNNGNAHFLRGLARALIKMGHRVICFEQADGWSIDNLRAEERGESSLQRFDEFYPEIIVQQFSGDAEDLRSALADFQIAIVHEWHSPQMVETLLALRDSLGLRMLFHDTHHRASSCPEQIRKLQVGRFDGVLAFGEALREIYLRKFEIKNVWTLHEAADTSVFFPRGGKKTTDLLWIGNWGDDERSAEIDEYLLEPARQLRERSFVFHGVRYPQAAMDALHGAGVHYGGYLPNLDAPAAYAAAKLTAHIPRQQYTDAMIGIPTIRVFEALACGIPLISAPWRDAEQLFQPGDFIVVHSGEEMTCAIERLLSHPDTARCQAQRGLETVLARHTCNHRAEQLTSIFEELLD